VGGRRIEASRCVTMPRSSMFAQCLPDIRAQLDLLCSQQALELTPIEQSFTHEKAIQQ